MRVLGLNAIGHHEASACLVENGEPTAFVEEERFTRAKHAVNQFPTNAVRWCLRSRGLTWADIDVIATPWIEEEFGVIAPPGYRKDVTFGTRDLGRDTLRWPRRLREFVVGAGCPDRSGPTLFQISHHLAHAASAYWCAGVDDAAILVADGEGDRVSTTVAYGSGGEIKLLRQFSTVDSLGQFYACLTSFLGLGDFGEGKLMGLAGYGRPRLEIPQIQITDDGYHIDLPGALRRWDPKGTDFRAIIAAWMRTLTDAFGPERPTSRERGRRSGIDEWPQADLDLAASGQRALESVLIHLARGALASTGSRNLVLAGGVALNCSANGAIADVLDVDTFFVQPAAGDNGAPLGSALHAAALMGDRPGQTLRSIATGPAFGPDDCKAALEESGLRYRAVDDAPDAAAECLARGDVVCWFDGAMEGGPRALGHRSILADPSTTATRDRVNDVKRRSLWRPLAPSVRMEDRAEVFESGRHSPFMIVADRVSPSWCSRISAVVHVDGTARPQTVDREVEPAYWSVIDGFHKRTGLPALINTSFNDEREPIVCSPADAIATFARNGADALCLGPYLIEKGD